MNKTIPMLKRVGAIFLCLSMLCGVIMSSVVLPTVAAAPSTNVETFQANFADLAALVDTTKYDANNQYLSKATDTAVNEWVNARFGVFAFREGSKYKEKEFLGQDSYDVVSLEDWNAGSADFCDPWGGHINLAIQKNGALVHYAPKRGDQILRKGHSLTVKNAYGDYAQLANFEAEMVFNKAGGNTLGSVFVSFHEKTPGKVNRRNDNFKMENGNEAVIIGNTGGSVDNAGMDGIIVGNVANTNTKTDDVDFAAALDNSADYKLTVKVVGTALTATVTKVADGSVVYTANKTIAAGNGYVSFGMANGMRAIKSVKVTELDENGNPVDFGTKRSVDAFTWTSTNKMWYGSGKYSADGNTLTANQYYDFVDQSSNSAKAMIAALNKQFDGYHVREGTLNKATIGTKVSYSGQTNNYVYLRGCYANKWLQWGVASVGGREIMRHIFALVPKGHDGQAFIFKNFEVTFTARLTTVSPNNGAAIVLGFRQQQAGKFTTGWFGMNQAQGLVAITSTGYNLAGGTQIIGARSSASNAAEDMYNKVHNTFATAIAKDSVVTVKVKAVGDQVYLKIQDDGTTIAETTKTIPYTEAGYISFGIGNYSSDISDIELWHLDEAGNRISLYEMSDAEYSVYAKKRNITFKNIPGAEYTGGKYTAVGTNYSNLSNFDGSVEEEVLRRVQMVYNDGATHVARGANYAKGNWIFFYNSWLQHQGAATSGTTRMTNIDSLIPLDENGIRQKTEHTQVSFEVRFEGGSKTVFVGLRQNLPGLFVTAENTPNQNQVLVAITRKSIRVGAGSQITWDRFSVEKDTEYTDDELSDVFSAELPQQTRFIVTLLGNTLTVQANDLSGGNLLYKNTFTVENYGGEGYTAIALANGGGNIGSMEIAKLNERGYCVDYPITSVLDTDFADGKDRLVTDFLVQANKVVAFEDGVYTPASNDSLINQWFGKNFTLRYNREDVTDNRAYPGQSSLEIDPNGVNTYWAFGENGTLVRKADADGAHMLEQYDSLVMKAPNGLTATLKNFMAEYTVYDADADKGAVVLSFRGSDRGKIADGEKSVYSDQSMVIIGTDKSGKAGVSIVDGINADEATYTTIDTEVAALKTAGAYKVTVKAVGTQVNVLITSLDGKTTYYSNASTPATINNIGNGYISLGVTNTTKAFGYLVLTELDENGAVIDYGTNTRSAGEKFWFTVRNIIPMETSTYMKEDGTNATLGGVYKASRWDANGDPILYGGEYVKDGEGNVVKGETLGDPTQYAQFRGTQYWNFSNMVGENAHPDASTVINYIDNKFAFYYNCEGKYYQMDAGMSKAYAGQDSNIGYWGSLYANTWFQRVVSAAGGAQNFRLISSLVPRNSVTGEELVMKNFETTFLARFEASGKSNNSVVVGFRQQTPGKFTNGYWDINKDQAFVMITRYGLTIAGGEDIVSNMARDPETGNGLHKSDEGDMYNADQTAVFSDTTDPNVITPLAENAELPQNIKVTVRVVNEKVTVIIANDSGSTVYYDNSANPATVNYDKEGYLAIGFGSKAGNVADVSIARLDNIGEQMDINGTDSVPGCEWDTSAERYSETMNKAEADINALYDFYYHGDNYVAKEALTDHWTLDSGILTHKADSGLATLVLKNGTQYELLKNFDAVFKVKIDEKKEGTFWVIGRQTDDATVGQLTATAGGTDYYTDRFAVGVSVGGKITIASGNGEAVEIAGPSNGTPTGTYNVRVRAYDRVLEVYLNGTLRATRTIAATAVDAGYLSFGYTGDELGIASLYLTRANDYGIAVDYETDYHAVETFEPQMVGVGADFSELTLPTTVEVYEGGTQRFSEVYWDPNSLDLSAESNTYVIGYLKDTNGVRAVYPVYVGKYNRGNTTVYNFESALELEDFESWYLPTTNVTDQKAIHTEGTPDDNWVIKNGKLTYQANSMNYGSAALKAGIQIGDEFYQDERSYSGYASNFGIAVLKTREFKNFILDVDVKGTGRWAPVGFGAEDYSDAKSVFATHKKGGYSFHVEYSSGTKGNAKLWGYDPAADACDWQVITGVDNYYGSGYNHYRIVVSDGVASLYLNNGDSPAITYVLPSTYDGGYIYLALNTGGDFDNLKIVDLDAEEIVITDVLTDVQDITINRELGESLTDLPRNLTVADRNGYEYTIAATWKSDDYRSYKDGTTTFELDTTAAWHNFDLSGIAGESLDVINNVGNDYDTATSRKYYFDHENDLLDFYQQESKHNYRGDGTPEPDYHSGYDGVLIENDNLFKISGGRVTNAFGATGMGSGWTNMKSLRGVASAVLKDVNFYNFRVEFDYTHSGMWYTYGIVGVQKDAWTTLYAHAGWSDKNNWENGYKETDVGKTYVKQGGLWVHLEQEGYINVQGAHGGGMSTRYTSTPAGQPILGSYDKSQTHHMSITVTDALVVVEIDNSGDVYYAALDDEALGGLVGFANHRQGSYIDNFQITALNVFGEPIDWADAVDGVDKGWAPEPIPDNYLGWKPKDDFTWGDEYED